VSLARNTGWALVGSLGSGPVVLLATVLLARTLSPAEHGQVQAALAWAAMFTALGHGGFVGATVQAAARGAPARAASVGLIAVTGTGALIVLGLAAGGPRWSSWALLGAEPAVIVALGAGVLPSLWTAIVAGAARGADRFPVSTGLELTGRVGRVVGWGLLAITAKLDPLSAIVVATAAEWVVALVAGRVWWRLPGPRDLQWEAAVQSGRFAASAFVAMGLGQLAERADVLLLVALGGSPAEVAQYAVAVGVAHRARTVPLALASALHPALAASPGRSAPVAITAWRWSLASAFGVSAAIAVASPWLLPWAFGPAYAASAVALLWLLPGVVAHASSAVIGRWFQARERQGVNIAAGCVSVVVVVGAGAWLIPRHGPIGAASSASLASVGHAAWLACAYLRARGVG
jgi:O-antigen/teichoic acid export membrane protein